MSDSARVRSVDVLGTLRGALVEFADQTVLALDSVASEIRRAEEWLQDQDRRWQTEIRTQEEAIFLAKQELTRRRVLSAGDRPVDCSEQEKTLRLARQRLEFAEEKLEITRHWLRQWDSTMIEFEGPTRQLKSFLESDVARACALLENRADSLEGYLAVAPVDSGARASVSYQNTESLAASATATKPAPATEKLA